MNFFKNVAFIPLCALVIGLALLVTLNTFGYIEGKSEVTQFLVGVVCGMIGLVVGGAIRIWVWRD